MLLVASLLGPVTPDGQWLSVWLNHTDSVLSAPSWDRSPLSA